MQCIASLAAPPGRLIGNQMTRLPPCHGPVHGVKDATVPPTLLARADEVIE